ncbi:MAG: peptide ABC transporter substrate-binding protein [Oscillospiraceae bacterium]|nr:peptide ABC transporter substrate-binding protein [Oscillospiraceae bacterium]
MKKKLTALALALALALGLAACGGNESTVSPDSAAAGTESTAAPEAASAVTDSAAAADAASMDVCGPEEPDALDPAVSSSTDDETLLLHLFSGLAKWEEDDNGVLKVVPDSAVELPEGVQNDDGTATYTYTLRDGLAWSDGQPVTASDFVFGWQRAASTELDSDYSYMYAVVDGYEEMWETDDDGSYVNPDAKLNARALDDKTVEITLNNAVPYWNELLAFPVFFPVREDIVADKDWTLDPSNYICNGAYTISEWDHDNLMTLTKNPYYHDADSVKMETIRFSLCDDARESLEKFKNGSADFIFYVPNDEVSTLKEQYPDELMIEGQTGTLFICWNINEDILPADSGLTGAEAELARAEIRRAVGLLLDRSYLVEEVILGGQAPASSFVSMGISDYDGSEFYKNAGRSSGFEGYYDVSADAFRSNVDTAMETLKKYYDYDEASGKLTDFPSMVYVYTGESHKAIAEYFRSALGDAGIPLEIEEQDWKTITENQKEGKYTLGRNAWAADYNDPICFLDMWASDSGWNYVHFGQQAHKDLAVYSLDLTPYGLDTKVENGTWAETYDVLIDAIKSCTDDENRYAMMHCAEDILMSTGCITPINYYTNVFMMNSSVKGLISTPLGFKLFTYCTVED